MLKLTKQQQKTGGIFYGLFVTAKQICELTGITKQALNRAINTNKLSKPFNPFNLEGGGGGLGLWLKDDVELNRYIAMQKAKTKDKLERENGGESN